jgi:hypothetical protein
MSIDRDSSVSPPQTSDPFALKRSRRRKEPTPIDVLSDLMAQGRRAVPADATYAHGDLYDEDGLPRS